MRKLWLALCLSAWGSCLPVFGQVGSTEKDSLTITGRLVWQETGVTGFPEELKITPKGASEGAFTAPVDSLGRFELSLARGQYLLQPSLYYHWMGEQWLRINEKKAQLALDLRTSSELEVVLPLDTIGWPKMPEGPGLFTRKEAIDPATVDAFIQTRMAFFKIPGVSLCLIQEGEIVYCQTYGSVRMGDSRKVTEQSLFEAGSITKLVFAFAAMRLYEKGLLDLDKPLVDYQPHPEIDDERYKTMTARHVLSHQSGMANWPRKDEAGKFKLKFAPGTQYGYSGKAYEYLKEVLVGITGKSINRILEEEVLTPLGLTDMHFRGDAAIEQYGVHGHKKGVPTEVYLAPRPMVAYTLQTTHQALAAFTLALMQHKGLKPATYEEMFRPHSQRADGTRWGLGVRIEETPVGLSYGHSGSTGRGFISNLVYYPDLEAGYVILTNSQMGGWLSLPLLGAWLVGE